MELGYSRVSFYHPSDESEFLEAMAYANESWFAFHRPQSIAEPEVSRSSPEIFLGKPENNSTIKLKANPAPGMASSQPLFAPIVQPTSEESLSPLQPRRSGSTSSVESSPEARKARPVPQPISPKPIERRRLRTFSSDDSEAKPSDDSSDDGSSSPGNRSSAMRKRPRANSTVCHTSAFRGVSCCGKDRKFQARIRDGSKVHYLGRFDNEFDAAIKYDKAARTHKGDSAMPNFVVMTPEEIQALRAHYFANNQQILEEFHHFLFQGTLERLEMKRMRRFPNGSVSTSKNSE